MKRLYFDTETTGFLAKEGTPVSKTPSICQIAAILVDDFHGEQASMNFLIKPNGWTIPAAVSVVHGITTEKAAFFGIPIRAAMVSFSHLCRAADQVVAHNISFDLAFVGYEMDKLGVHSVVHEKPIFCTMAGSQDACKIPGKYAGSYKRPKLIEAHTALLGVGFEDAHDALADVRACQRIHRALIDQFKM